MSNKEIRTESFECPTLGKIVTITKVFALLRGNNGVVVDRTPCPGWTCSGHGSCTTFLGQPSCAYTRDLSPRP